jgi:aminopeptidase N
VRRAALLLALAWPAAADVYPRQPGVDALHYVFRLSLTDQSDEISGEASVQLRLLASDAREAFLDLATAADGKGMQVQSASCAGQPVAFSHAGDRLRLPLPHAAKAGDVVTFTIAYRGVPRDGLRFVRNIHGERTVFSENWPDKARAWLPMIDHPYDKATGELIVTAPAQYQAVSNGLLLEELDLPGGLRRTHWRQSVPIASWLFALGVARFAVNHVGSVAGVPLQSWVFPQDRDKGYPLFEPLSRSALVFLAANVGAYPYEKLANVQAAGMGGGTEHASAIFYGEKNVADGRVPVVHEIAHQWFGDSVTERDWDDVWLSEGFATYFTLLHTEKADGREAFVAGLLRSRETVLKLEQSLPDTPVVHRNLADMRRVLNGLVYQKGGWTLHMLRGLIGDAAFWTGIRAYYSRYREKNASSDEFRAVMEEASGKPLDRFFQQWLHRAGVPKLSGSWRYDAATRQLSLRLAQGQAGEPYRLPLQVGIREGTATRIEKVELTAREETFRLPTQREPADVVLDPETWLLFEGGKVTKEKTR